MCKKRKEVWVLLYRPHVNSLIPLKGTSYILLKSEVAYIHLSICKPRIVYPLPIQAYPSPTSLLLSKLLLVWDGETLMLLQKHHFWYRYDCSHCLFLETNRLCFFVFLRFPPITEFSNHIGTCMRSSALVTFADIFLQERFRSHPSLSRSIN